jgi:hypothetical protein
VSHHVLYRDQVELADREAAEGVSQIVEAAYADPASSCALMKRLRTAVRSSEPPSGRQKTKCARRVAIATPLLAGGAGVAAVAGCAGVVMRARVVSR